MKSHRTYMARTLTMSFAFLTVGGCQSVPVEKGVCSPSEAIKYTSKNGRIEIKPRLKYELILSIHVLQTAEDHHQLFVPWAEQMRKDLSAKTLKDARFLAEVKGSKSSTSIEDKLVQQACVSIFNEVMQTRVTDKRMLRLIRKWLKVGWFEDGKRHAAAKGSAQGSVISPLLANIFLNAAMDQWFLNWRTTQAKGDVIMVRFADDAVLGFQYEAEGRTFLEALRKRLESFQLTLHPQKTRKRWTLERFYRLQRQWISRPRIVHPYPGIRFDAKYSR